MTQLQQSYQSNLIKQQEADIKKRQEQHDYEIARDKADAEISKIIHQTGVIIPKDFNPGRFDKVSDRQKYLQSYFMDPMWSPTEYTQASAQEAKAITGGVSDLAKALAALFGVATSL